MSERPIPKPDVALKKLFKDDTIFADLFNGYLFNNEKVIIPSELEPVDTAYSVSIQKNGKKKVENLEKYRDVVRKTSLGYFVLLGVEDQDEIHYAMPVRKMLYDVLEYCSEVDRIGKAEDMTEWTVGERLSKVKKGTMITPIITIVFYTGEKEWDGPKSLHEMMAIDERIKPFVPDYPLYVVDMGHDRNLSFSNKFLSDLNLVLSAIYSNESDNIEVEVDNSVYALAGILVDDIHLYRKNQKGGSKKVCEALQERDRIKLAEKNAELAEKDSKLAEMDAKIAEKDAEIAELKRLLAMKNAN